MCGLFGCSGPGIVSSDLVILKEMGMVTSVRGTDSAGMFQTRTVGAESLWGHLEGYYKTTGPWTDLIDDLEADKKWYPHLMNSINIDVFMAHVRQATKGAIITDNAHPFETDKYVGCHNGTLVDHKYQHKNRTDSQMMFEDMDRQGVQKTLSMLSAGSAATVSIYEKSSKTLLFASNGKRPLWFCNLKGRSVTYWASEPGILTFVLGRNGISFNKPEPFPKHILARLTPSNIRMNNNMSGWTEVAKLPGWYQMKEDEKLLEEALKKSSVVDVANEVRSSTAITVIKSPKQEQKTQKTFEGTRTESPLETFRLKCDCGKITLNVFRSHLCRRNTPGLPKYKELTNTFECSDSCKPKPVELVRA